MIEKIDTVIVGAGQAGLSVSYYLKQANAGHIVLEQAAQAANAWRNDRWDSFCLNTPNWTFCLPGTDYQKESPQDFSPLTQIINRFDTYVARFDLPIRYNTRVLSVEGIAEGSAFLVTSEHSRIEATNVVIATGLFQKPKIPAFSTKLSDDLLQLHSGQYRNPDALPPGAILVVGSSQSGAQIAEELYQVGRQVYLCVGKVGRIPRRYRGKDAFEWMQLAGFLDRTVDNLQSPQEKFVGNPHISGSGGGHTINLHQFAHDGVVLLGRLQDADQHNIRLALDLKNNLVKIDQFEADFTKKVDEFIIKSGLKNIPPENLPNPQDGFKTREISELNLKSAGITTVIWATGYQFDFSFVKLPVFDQDGFPIQKRGQTDFRGLFFIGLPWLFKFKSGLLGGVAEDANYIVSRILDNYPQDIHNSTVVL